MNMDFLSHYNDADVLEKIAGDTECITGSFGLDLQVRGLFS